MARHSYEESGRERMEAEIRGEERKKRKRKRELERVSTAVPLVASNERGFIVDRPDTPRAFVGSSGRKKR